MKQDLHKPKQKHERHTRGTSSKDCQPTKYVKRKRDFG